MFYFFFESRGSSSDPVVLWLTGGPGCSSELALFYENGPFHIADNMSLIWNDYGWDKVHLTYKAIATNLKGKFYIQGLSIVYRCFLKVLPSLCMDKMPLRYMIYMLSLTTMNWH